MSKNMTPEEKYKRNQKLSKRLRIIAPICFWVCLALAVVCLVFALKNSFGNLAEISNLLDSKKYTGEQLQSNYAFLIDKYGEWVIGNGAKGFVITFVNVKKAVFSGVMLVNVILCGVFIASAYILGKWILPKISKQILIDNQDLVNLTILKSSEKDKEK